MPAFPDALEVPLFPLPGMVFFPGTILPLRVFEPRYVKLLQDTMASNKLIGMAHVKPNSFLDENIPPPLYDVLGVGTVVAHEANEDGTFKIALLGQARCRIAGEIPHSPYRIARVTRVNEKAPSTAAERAKFSVAFDGLLMAARSVINRTMPGEAGEQFKNVIEGRGEKGSVADLLASVYVQEADLRQALLESIDLLARTQILRAIMEKLVAKLEPGSPPLNFDHGGVCLN